MERLGRSIRKMLKKVHTGKFRNLDVPDILHPYIRNLRQETVDRLEQPRQYFTFTDILFPKSLRQGMVFFVSGGNTFDTGQFHAEVEFVNQPLLPHTLRYSSVHGETELRFYFFELFF
ncbi:unknown [Bacteroides clarus CAG:160]|nr:unknown [Bacteroides clarus CAG:160]